MKITYMNEKKAPVSPQETSKTSNKQRNCPEVSVHGEKHASVVGTNSSASKIGADRQRAE